MNRVIMHRRQFIQTVAASFASIGISPFTAFAQPMPPVRREVHSAEAEPVLDQYRQAIAIMKGLPVWDPRSWWFQANIHGVPFVDDIQGCSSATCLDDIFTPPADATDEEREQIRALELLARGDMARGPTAGLSRDRVWSKCPHGKLDFLPWHRLYLWYFERIVSEVLDEPFALPYWGYLDTDKRNLPPAFRSPTMPDGSTNHLFYANRNSRALEETPDPNDPLLREIDLNWTRSDEQNYFQRGDIFESEDGTFEFGVGFSSQVESQPHNQVHVRIGNSLGMGNPSYAGRDPIFYVHHAQIDRLWEIWRAQDPAGRDLIGVGNGGNEENAFSNEPYVFALADGSADGYSAHVFPQFVGNIYNYDTLSPVTTSTPGPSSLGASADRRRPKRQSISRESTVISDTPVRIQLSPVGSGVGPAGATPLNISERRFVLRIEASMTSKAGGTIFDIYLDTPNAEAQKPGGSISVFMDPAKTMTQPSLAAPGSEDPQTHHHMSGTFEADVTETVRAALESGAELSDLTVRLEPSSPVPEGSFTIETIDLLEQ